MELIKIDPRALKENPNPTRRTKSNPQSDALMLASIKALGIIQPPVVYPTLGAENEMTIHVGSRRVRLAVQAGLEEIEVLVIDPESEGGLMRELVENVAREALNPVDLWRSIERLTDEGWTEEAIVTALALPLRQVKKLRLLAKVVPAMLDHIAKGDMPLEQHLQVIAAAPPEEQAQVWRKHKPTKAHPQAVWWEIARSLQKRRMYARDASFGDDLAQAYGIVWTEDLFAEGDQDNRYTTDVDAYLGAQHECMSNHLPKRGVILEVGSYGEAKLPPKAERVYGEPKKTDSVGYFLDRNGTVQTVPYRMPVPAKPKTGAKDTDVTVETPRPSRPDVTRKGQEMIGAFRTDALHEALRNAPIEDDTLLALLVLAVAGLNVSVQSAHDSGIWGRCRFDQHAVQLVDAKGALAFEREALQRAARSTLIELLSCKLNQTNSGLVAEIAGSAIGADTFLPNMGTDEYLSCLSRPALEAVCVETTTQPRQRVKYTRAALVAEFEAKGFVHANARFRPDRAVVKSWQTSVANALAEADRREASREDGARDDAAGDEDLGDHETDLGEAQDPGEREHLVAAE